MGLVKDGYLLEFNGIKTTTFFNLRKDSLQKTNLVGKKKKKKKKKKKPARGVHWKKKKRAWGGKKKNFFFFLF